MIRYWIAVASHEHVKRGVSGGFAQVCHGKMGPLKRMYPGDWIIYYSPSELFGEKMPCRKFTAIGRIKEGVPYEYAMSKDFVPWRRDVAYLSVDKVSIETLLDHLSFIKSKFHWGFPFRRGCFEISYKDFMAIANKMGVILNDQSP